MVKKILIDGLKFLIPVGITLLVIYWLLNWAEKILSNIVVGIFGDRADFTGIGLLFGLVLVAVFGVILQMPFVRNFFGKILDTIMNFPLIRPVYRVSSDLMNFFQEKNYNKGRVVLCDTSAGKFMGILTLEKFEDLPKGCGEEGDAAVYLPMSYQLGGFMVLVPKESLEYVDMSTEDAISFIMSAGLSKNKNHAKSSS